MVELYAVRSERLPEPEELLPRVRVDVGGKRREWETMKKARAKESIAGILLLQAALREKGIPCESVKLSVSPSGRPEIPGVGADFNLSHTDGLIVCAIESGEENPRVGVDAERIKKRDFDSMQRIAERWFSAQELEAFRQDGSEETFLRIWTGKEAAVKWTGDGLKEIKRADTTRPHPVAGAKLVSYSLPDFAVSLCHREGTIPPEKIRLLSVDEICIK